MKHKRKEKDEPFWGITVLVGGVLVFLLALLAMPNKDNVKNDNKNQYVYYNVPTYTTVYEIVYPDSVFKYTAVHHSPSRLSSFRGTNYLHSDGHYGNISDRGRPDYWVDEWNNSELDVQTTAPIRIVSKTVSYKKVKYIMK